MTQWWNGLSVYQNILFVIAVTTTLFMIIQIIIMLVSGAIGDTTFDSDTTLEADANGGESADSFNNDSLGMTFFGLRIITLRSIIAFLAIGSWVIFTFIEFMPVWAATLIGLVCGFAAAVGVAWLMKAVFNLQSNGNINIKNAVGTNGEVYLVIPAKRSGNGKVNVFIQERFVEYEAITDSETPIKTGDKIKVVEVISEGILLVEKLA